MRKLLGVFLACTMMVTATACSKNEVPSSKTEVTAAAESDQDSLFTAGTYEAVVDGHNDKLKVAVTVSEDKIEKVEILEHKETAGISDTPLKKIPEEIVKFQSIAVDTVAGATVTSNAIIAGVKAALLEAGATEEEISKEIAKEEVSKEIIKKSADAVIIGAGGAGMSAAAEVIKAGGSVIVLEKMPAIGGNTILAGSAYNTSNPESQGKKEMKDSEMEKIEQILELEPENDLMKEWLETLKKEIDEYKASGATYLFDSPSFHKLQTYYGGDYVANPELIDVLCDNSLDGLNFLSELGTNWVDSVNAAVGATWQRSHTPTPDFGSKGASFVLPQAKYVEENGGEVLLEHKAEELIMENGKCVGVKGTTADGQPFEITADKGVILATGGFGANVEMRQKYNTYWDVLDETIKTTNHVGATGDGIVMAEEVNANLVGMEWIQILPTYGPGVFTPYIENQMYINLEGERFVRENGRRDELSQAVLSQTKGEIYILSDANTVKDGKTVAGLDVDERVGNGYAFKADTLEDLAKQINIPYEKLKATVDQFNNSVKTGEDPFGRQLFDKEFGEGPFYAGLTSPMVHHTMGGVEVNTQAQVMDKDGNVIEGLFAAGEVTGGIHGSNRLGGNAIADITVFGRIAGQNVMK